MEADQTQSAFGRMSFGSEQFNQYMVDDKVTPHIDKEQVEDDFVKEKEKNRNNFVESETESKKKEESLQNSKLKDQIVNNNFFLNKISKIAQNIGTN